MDAIRSVRLALRVLAGSPGFAVVAVLVLGLGIGANTAIFSIVNTLLFKPLRIERPEQLVGCFSKDTEKPDSYRPFSYPNFVDLRDQNTVFSNLTAHNLALVGLTKDGLTRRIIAEVIAANFFSTFGVPLFRGRSFTPEEERPGSGLRAVIVSYPFWQKEGADPDYVGKGIDINGRSYTVVGIAPKDFTAATALISTELWFPLGQHGEIANDFMGSARRSLDERDNYSLVLIGRLKDGVTVESADSELAVLAAQLAETYPDANRNQTFVVNPLPRMGISTEPSDDSELEAVAVLLSATAAAVLLIACLNLASMTLARGTMRRKELAIRLAIGGRRGPSYASSSSRVFSFLSWAVLWDCCSPIGATRFWSHRCARSFLSTSSFAPVPMFEC
ncbi:MAG TPA: ABC transporter permease [Vicinamibacteria bacterium]|nr:ABC transporter permease [Vicinamibacteria bacterium]